MKKNKFFFGKRSKKKSWAPAKWDIAGGHALPEEDPLQTLKRETYEETGITVLHARLLDSLEVPDKSIHENFKYNIYMITSWKGKPYNASNEHTKMRWFTRRELQKRKLAMRVYLKMVDDWLKE